MAESISFGLRNALLAVATFGGYIPEPGNMKDYGSKYEVSLEREVIIQTYGDEVVREIPFPAKAVAEEYRKEQRLQREVSEIARMIGRSCASHRDAAIRESFKGATEQ